MRPNVSQVLAVAAISSILLASCGTTPSPTPTPTPTPSRSLPPSPAASPSPSASAQTPGASPSQSTPTLRLPQLGQPDHPFQITALASGAGGVAALASEQNGLSVPVLLTSTPDGVSWSLRGLDVPGAGFEAIAAGPTGLFAAAQGDGDSIVIARSTDLGATWTLLATLAHVLTPQLVSGPAGLLLIGQDDSGGTSTTAAWLSTDGLRWTGPIAMADFADPHGVALSYGFVIYDSGLSGTPRMAVLSAGGLVAIPAEELQLGSQASWSSGPFLPAVVVLGDMLYVVRQDARGASVWQASARDLGAGARFSSVTGGPGLLPGVSIVAGATGAAGIALLGFDRTTLGRFALVSSNGRSWERRALPADALGGGISAMLAATAAGYVAVGRAVTLAGGADDLWASIDGVAWTRAAAPAGPAPTVSPGSCPARPSTLAGLAAIGAARAADCFGRSNLTFSAYVGTCGGCGGTTLYRWTPDWLGGMFAPLYLAADITTASTGLGDVGPAWPDPAFHVRIPPEKTPVLVTGHYNDPVSPTCRVIPVDAVVAPLPSVEEAVMFCRRSLVVTAISVRH